MRSSRPSGVRWASPPLRCDRARPRPRSRRRAGEGAAEHPVADRELGHAVADLVHDARIVVPEPARQAQPESSGGVSVGGHEPVHRVQPGRGHPHPDLLRAHRRRRTRTEQHSATTCAGGSEAPVTGTGMAMGVALHRDDRGGSCCAVLNATGKSTIPLAQQGFRITCVEIDPDLAAAMQPAPCPEQAGLGRDNRCDRINDVPFEVSIPFRSGVSPGRFGAHRGWLRPGWSRRSCGRSVQRGCGRSSRSGPTGWRSPDS